MFFVSTTAQVYSCKNRLNRDYFFLCLPLYDRLHAQLFTQCNYYVRKLLRLLAENTDAWFLQIRYKINFIMNEVNERRRLREQKVCVVFVFALLQQQHQETDEYFIKALKYIKNDDFSYFILISPFYSSVDFRYFEQYFIERRIF